MPLYEYKCAACGAGFEKLMRLAEAEGQLACPECGSSHTKR